MLQLRLDYFSTVDAMAYRDIFLKARKKLNKRYPLSRAAKRSKQEAETHRRFLERICPDEEQRLRLYPYAYED
jgi:hypothetical protein